MQKFLDHENEVLTLVKNNQDAKDILEKIKRFSSAPAHTSESYVRLLEEIRGKILVQPVDITHLKMITETLITHYLLLAASDMNQKMVVAQDLYWDQSLKAVDKFNVGSNSLSFLHFLSRQDFSKNKISVSCKIVSVFKALDDFFEVTGSSSGDQGEYLLIKIDYFAKLNLPHRFQTMEASLRNYIALRDQSNEFHLKQIQSVLGRVQGLFYNLPNQEGVSYSFELVEKRLEILKRMKPDFPTLAKATEDYAKRYFDSAHPSLQEKAILCLDSFLSEMEKTEIDPTILDMIASQLLRYLKGVSDMSSQLALIQERTLKLQEKIKPRLKTFEDLMLELESNITKKS